MRADLARLIKCAMGLLPNTILCRHVRIDDEPHDLITGHLPLDREEVDVPCGLRRVELP
jgi:hypothetical protein